MSGIVRDRATRITEAAAQAELDFYRDIHSDRRIVTAFEGELATFVGYPTHAATDAALFAPVLGETRTIAGVRCTYDGASYLGAERGWGVCAIERGGVWSVAVTHARLDVRDAVVGHAADLDDAAMEAMRRVAALCALEAFGRLTGAVA